ncbi:hypothetical protein QG37_00060 [Candidozyma auris]|uniref:Uncharacterized protein n=1 Tax=Candidozyma auris TaxID=498019 RepID=A0A0L0P8I7_CANAR|nr:hypothetical protein QG37_00060 [[Candida] auris]
MIQHLPLLWNKAEIKKKKKINNLLEENDH